jgi:acyl carrier protein
VTFPTRQPAKLTQTAEFGQKQTFSSTYDWMKTMRSPSRFIPPRSEKDISCVWLLGALLAGFGYFVYSSSNTARYATVVLILAFCVWVAVINKRGKRRLEGICSTRDEESICAFAQSFSTRHVDTWVIRAAHQEIQQLMKSYVSAFPVRASDSLLDDLNIDSDDIEDLLVDIATRSGHSLDETEKNPFYGKMNTVRDLVLFVNAQQRLATIRPSA